MNIEKKASAYVYCIYLSESERNEYINAVNNCDRAEHNILSKIAKGMET
jgi:hypothetical protein